jgi:hypothetical protein
MWLLERILRSITNTDNIPSHWAAVPPAMPAHDLYAAWWGQNITPREIQPNSDPMDDESKQLVVDIDQGLWEPPLGEILLRREFLNTLTFLESWAEENPKPGVIISGQRGIGQ